MTYVTKNISPMARAVVVNPQSVNMDTREFDISFASEAPVLMQPWWDEPFYEVLSMAGMRTIRLDSGAPLLDNHDRHGSVREAVIGVVVRHWQEGDKAYARIKLSAREDMDGLLRDIQDGIIRNVSCGYRVYKYEETPRTAATTIPTYRATDWEPFEVSLVPVGADASVGVRSNNDKYNVQIVRQMSQQTTTNPTSTEPTGGAAPTPPATPPVAPAVNEEEVRRLAVEAERKRVAGINEAVRALKLNQAIADALITEGVSLDVARQRAIEEWAKGDPKPNAPQRVTVVTDERDTYRAAAINALVLRSGQVPKSKFKADELEAARPHQRTHLLDLCRRALDVAGIDYSLMDKQELVQRALSSNSSDLPVILEGTNRRILLENYALAGDAWRLFCATGSVGDFREYKRLRMGSFSRLDKIQENGEYKNKPIPDAEQEKVSVETFGNTINLTRKMIINDDLAAFTRLAAMLGRAAARSIEIDVFALLALNGGLGPTMEDGKTLFHADHGNIATGGAPSVDVFDAMRVLMAQQKDPSGNDFLDIRPAVGLFPISLGGKVRIINGSQYDPDVTGKFQVPNKVNGMLSTLVDTPRMTGTRFYMFADPQSVPTLEVSFLDGIQEPYLENQTTFDVDGMRWKIRLDYGVGAVDWRGALTNAGA